MSTKNYRIQGGNEMVISTVLGLFSFSVSDILFCIGNTHDSLSSVPLSSGSTDTQNSCMSRCCLYSFGQLF